MACLSLLPGPKYNGVHNSQYVIWTIRWIKGQLNKKKDAKGHKVRLKRTCLWSWYKRAYLN